MARSKLLSTTLVRLWQHHQRQHGFPTVQRAIVSPASGSLAAACSRAGTSISRVWTYQDLLHDRGFCSQNAAQPSVSHSPAHAQDEQQQQQQHAAGLLKYLPSAAIPYAQLMRLDKPIGTWLLAWPGLWSIALAAQPGQLPDLWLITLFSIGAVLLRGAGCTVNDLWDRNLDRRVERTRSRPLASGAVTPTQAMALLVAQLLLGLVVLLQLNDYSKLMGASSLLLVGTYPLMKRITYWPQAFLGLTINWGALLGYAAAKGYCDWSIVLPLYIASLNWTLVYDTIYAHQDKKDDITAGVKSTALLFGGQTKQWLTGFAALQVACLLTAGTAADIGWPYFAGIAAAAGHLAWQIKTVDLEQPPDCMAKFVSNKWVGGIIFAGTVGGRLVS